MRIKDLIIKNYRGLVDFEIYDAPSVVVLVGPNGTGKSSILEAISFFKERIGPYYGWSMPATVVNVNAPFAEISATFDVYQEEKEYIKKIYNREIGKELTGTIKVGRDGNLLDAKRPEELYWLLTAYRLKDFPKIGIFDYNWPYRTFIRKDITSINVGGFTDQEEKRRRLTSPEAKFTLTKDYLAQLSMGDVQKLYRKVKEERVKAGIDDLTDSLVSVKKIFNNLLAPKEFIGVDFSTSPIKFIIKTPQGEVDIDDLSSGEKEILFVYTEFLKLNPQNSVILFDEPDLHLNQEVERKIVEVLKSLGNNNQFWIATHSLGIMDSVEYNELFRLENYSAKNQVTQVFDDKGKYETFKAVAGNVSTVTLGQKIVFLEGIEWTDKQILETLFLQSKGKLIFVPSGSYCEVMTVSQKILDLLSTSSKFNFYFAIRDRDFMDEKTRKEIISKGNSRLFVWEKYHIENYLIDFDVIFAVLKTNLVPCPCSDPKDIEEKMKEIVNAEKERFVSKMVNYKLNTQLKGAYFNIGFPDVEKQAVDKASELKKDLSSTLDKENIKDIVQKTEKELAESITSGNWVNILPGRDLLKLFISKHGKPLAYEPLKNQLVNELRIQRKISAELEGTIKQILDF